MLAPIIFVSEQHYQVGIMAFQIEADHSSATWEGRGSSTSIAPGVPFPSSLFRDGKQASSLDRGWDIGCCSAYYAALQLKDRRLHVEHPLDVL